MNKLSLVTALVLVEVIEVKVELINLFIFKEVALVLGVDKTVVVVPPELVDAILNLKVQVKLEIRVEVFSVVLKLIISVVVT